MSFPFLGVVVVTFNSTDVILDCLESLLAAQGVRLAIAVVDNASVDDTTGLIRAWASGERPYVPADDLPFALRPAPKPLRLLAERDPLPNEGHSVALIETGLNGGFAAGVNRGLAYLAGFPEIERFWVLNPDSAVPPETPRAVVEAPGGFGLMGGRVLYLDTPDRIQIDGGTINRLTGVTGNSGLGRSHAATPAPDPAALDFITGASMVVSRTFYEAAGPMKEDYFLYYEEVDWALRRGNLPLAYCPQAIVYHRAGTAIGSPTLGRPASPFSLYFKHRGRMRFLRRFFPWSLPAGLAYSLAKAGQLAARGYGREAWTIMAGSLGLPPPASVRARLAPEAQALAFGRPKAQMRPETR
ncbi:glycosyltransferase family 2 protein [Rubellimicrobium roseum]|uniref:Glycosyltransferase family 2 protein n=1 Tax=Rubellimicrobium roseum TaxID=687525 RepID=A0A5C4NLL8_9RHOB|nr:glycosyltransferase family 2 protein [Rubellimicrobium roseum]TNC74785.1 glycosyltransferase family 2 protein [Rubellimicrobium roseum]